MLFNQHPDYAFFRITCIYQPEIGMALFSTPQPRHQSNNAVTLEGFIAHLLV